MSDEILLAERVQLEDRIEELEATVEAFRENRAGQYLKRIEQLEAAHNEALEYLQREGTPYVNSAIAALQENNDD